MKDYKNWHKLKEKINNKENIVYFREKQIWWCSIGANIGFEQDGKNEDFERPILILKKFNAEIFLALPITSSNKKGDYYYQYKHNEKDYSVILSQIRLMSSKRLLRKIRLISEEEIDKIKKKLIKLL